MEKRTDFNEQFISNIKKRATREKEEIEKNINCPLLEARDYNFPVIPMKISDDLEYGESI